MKHSYCYDPSNIRAYGKDRMRFELGDVMVEGGAETCALCDEEYTAIIPAAVRTPRQWKKAKYKCLESIMHRFAFEVDTKDGPLSLSLGSRAKLWRDLYNQLDEELKKGAASAGAILNLSENPDRGALTPPYFYNGMMSTEESEGADI